MPPDFRCLLCDVIGQQEKGLYRHLVLWRGHVPISLSIFSVACKLEQGLNFDEMPKSNFEHSSIKQCVSTY